MFGRSCGSSGPKTDWYRDAGRLVEEKLGTHAARAARIWKTTLAALAAVVSVLALAGCGGSGERQDADSPTGTWKVAVEEWKFPSRQPLGRPATMKIVVRNIDTRDIPAVVFTIGGLRTPVQQKGSATRTRPIWIVTETRHRRSDAVQLADANLPSQPVHSQTGETRTFELPLTPLRRGEHVVSYTLAASLFDGAKLETVDGDPAAGSRTVAIDPTPDFDERPSTDRSNRRRRLSSLTPCSATPPRAQRVAVEQLVGRRRLWRPSFSASSWSSHRRALVLVEDAKRHRIFERVVRMPPRGRSGRAARRAGETLVFPDLRGVVESTCRASRRR